MRWAVVGVGVAGAARCRAIVSDPRASLVAVWRGRRAAEAGAPIAADLADAVARAEAVAIASPTAAHVEGVEAALRRDRHVVVEYPIAPTAAEAERLFALARERGRLLHVAHIELLTPVALRLRAEIRAEDVTSAEVAFETSGLGSEGAPALALANVARLMRLTDVCGPVEEVEPELATPGLLTARFGLHAGGVGRARFSAGPGLKRRTTMRIEAKGRTWVFDGEDLSVDGAAVPLAPSPRLFAADQLVATARLLDGGSHYVTDAAIVHALDLAESLSKPVRSRLRCHETLRGT